MVLAEKCPNCGAFLPVRQRGVTTRKCEFCELVVPGDTRTIEVPKLTADASEIKASTWLPPGAPGTPPRQVDPAALQRTVRRATGTALFVTFAIMLAVCGGVGFAVYKGKQAVEKRLAPVRAMQADRERREQEWNSAVALAGGVKSFDIMKFIPFATGLARGVYPDAVLTRVQLSLVRPDGTSDFTLDSGSSYLELRSPSHSRPPEGTPAGVDPKLECSFYFGVSQSVTPYEAKPSGSGRDCVAPLLEGPHCSPADIWTRALADGAPQNAVASLYLSLDADDHKETRDVPSPGRWHFSISSGVDTPGFFHEYPDDCGVVAADHAALAPPEALSDALMRALKKQMIALHTCFKTATAGHDEIEGVDVDLTIVLGDPRKLTVVGHMDVEGIFSGNMGAIERQFAQCAARRLDAVPASLPSAGLDTEYHLSVHLRIERAGKMSVSDLAAH